MRIRVGTRGSPLALAQTETALRRLRALHPGDTFTVEVIQSSGDRSPEAPLASMPRGVFAKELEAALAGDVIDIAVHSFKDLPIEASPGCLVAAVTERGDPRDVLVSPGRASLADIPAHGRIGTSSPRRKALLQAMRPDLDVAPVRGNVGTRVGKAGAGGARRCRGCRGGSCPAGNAGCCIRDLRSGVVCSRGRPGCPRSADSGRR